jgi:hypothetical protein
VFLCWREIEREREREREEDRGEKERVRDWEIASEGEGKREKESMCVCVCVGGVYVCMSLAVRSTQLRGGGYFNSLSTPPPLTRAQPTSIKFKVREGKRERQERSKYNCRFLGALSPQAPICFVFSKGPCKKN